MEASRAGTSVGRAVHAVLQSIDLATGEGIAERARAQAAAEGVPGREGEIERLCHVAVDSDIVKRAVASQRYWREVPVAVGTGNGSLHGFIDLLFEAEEGLVVVDYKTDAIAGDAAPEAVQRYRLQGGAYAHALQELTGEARGRGCLPVSAAQSRAAPSRPGRGHSGRRGKRLGSCWARRPANLVSRVPSLLAGLLQSNVIH